MNSHELFEFKNYLDDEKMTSIEFIFVSQALKPDFKEFNTSLGSNGKDYLSFLIANALVDGTITSDEKGLQHFFELCNGFTERFFQTTTYHLYNLCENEKKNELFNTVVEFSKEHVQKNKGKKFNEYKHYQLLEYMHNFNEEMDMNPHFFSLGMYEDLHKELKSRLLNNELQKDLEHKNSSRNISKI